VKVHKLNLTNTTAYGIFRIVLGNQSTLTVSATHRNLTNANEYTFHKDRTRTMILASERGVNGARVHLQMKKM